MPRLLAYADMRGFLERYINPNSSPKMRGYDSKFWPEYSRDFLIAPMMW